MLPKTTILLILSCIPTPIPEDLNRIFRDDWTLWYDESTIPRAMQFGLNSEPVSIHDGYHRFNDIDRTTNANIEFPWKDAGGTHLVDNLINVKFYWHPRHEAIQVFRTTKRSLFRSQQGIDWKFPIDSVVGEILAFKRNSNSNSKTYVFEIRTLTREADNWSPSVYRRFNTNFEVADALWEIGEEKLAYKIGNGKVNTLKYTDTVHRPPNGKTVFEVEYETVDVSSITSEISNTLLRKPLKQVFEASNISTTRNNILPANYIAPMIGMDIEDCMKCHNHVNKHVDNFDRVGRDWYGYVRGSNNIFSFHPFDRSAISRNGGMLPIRYNSELLKAGYVK